MKTFNTILISLAVLFTYSCENNGESLDKETRSDEIKSEINVDPAQGKSMNVDSLIAVLDQKRSHIEQNISNPIEIKTENLREKIKQKWEKIHFYLLDGEIVRIKTYPYTQISQRTEEFYIEKGNLYMVVVQDNGLTNRGQNKEKINKLFYFDNGMLIQELHSNMIPEYSIRKGDALELISEFNEYSLIHKESMK